MSRKIFIAGHNGMVGRAVVRAWRAAYQDDVIVTRSRAQLDLADQAAVREFYSAEQPDIVIIAAAKVGGIHANATYPADFIYDNIIIAANLIHGAYHAGVSQLLNLGSSCIYPRLAAQPISEDALLTGALEPTNAPYAVAKIAAIKLCESYNRQHGTDFRSLMPTNLYGPYDNFQGENSHVIPALMRRFHEAARDGAPSITIWGSGSPMREFLHVDDMASACLFTLATPKGVWNAALAPNQSHVNVGTGRDVTIKSLAQMMAEVTGYEGVLNFDTARPDGAPRKLLDVSKMSALGWDAKIDLHDGLKASYLWFRDHSAIASERHS